MKRIALLLLLIIPIVGHATVTTQTTSVSFTCTGSIGPYPFAYPITDATAMTVTQNGTLLAPTSYTVSPVNNNYVNGGSVTLNTACPSGGNILLLVRATPLTQTTVFTDNMPVPMKSIERGLDKLTEIAQEKAVEINGVPFCSGFAPTAGQIVEYATTSTPNPCWQAVNGGTVTGITAVTATAPVDCTTTGSTVNCLMAQATSSVDGYLSHLDWATFNRNLSSDLAMQVVPPIAGQYVVIYPTAYTAGCLYSNCAAGSYGTPMGSVSSAYLRTAGTAFAAGQTVTWSGFSLPSYVAPANVTAIYATASSEFRGLNEYHDFNAVVAGGGNVNLFASGGGNYSMQQVTAFYSSDPTKVATAVITGDIYGQSFEGCCNKGQLNIANVALIVYYTGTPPPANTAIQVAPPLYYNPSTDILSIDPYTLFPGENLYPTTVAGLPSANLWTIGTIYSVTDGTTATDCTTGGGTNTVLCQTNGTVWSAFSAGGSSTYQLTGDVTTPSGTGSQVATLATVNSASGICGDATHVCQVTTNEKGLTTAQTTVAISGSGSGVSQIIAGTNVTISPTGGTGAVTINATAGSSGVQYNPTNTLYVFTGDSVLGDDTHVLAPQITVTGGSCNGTICTITNSGTNGLSAGDWIYQGMTGFPTPPAPFGTVSTTYGFFQVLATGLSSTQFEFNYTYATATITGGTVQRANYFLAQQTMQQPFFKGYGSFQIVTDANYYVANIDTDYTTLFHSISPAVTGNNPEYLIINDIFNNDLQGCATAATIKGHLQSIWAKAHTDGWIVVQGTATMAPWNSSGCAPYANAYAVNNWLYSQGKNATNTTGLYAGEFWDTLADVGAVLSNPIDTTLIATNGGMAPGGVQPYAQILNEAMGLQASAPKAKSYVYYGASAVGGNTRGEVHTPLADSYHAFVVTDAAQDAEDLRIDTILHAANVNTLNYGGSLNGSNQGGYGVTNTDYMGNLNTGRPQCHVMGVGNAAYNHAYTCFNYVGSGSASNNLVIGLHGDNNYLSEWPSDANNFIYYPDGSFMPPGGVLGPATAPSGSCTRLGAFISSQDGKITYCPASGTWTTYTPTVGTWAALNYPTWTSGTPFVKMTAAGTFALDTNTYGTFTLPSLISGSVLFSDGSTIAQDNSNFFWDATNHRLGIGTTSPGNKLDVNGNFGILGSNGLRLYNSANNQWATLSYDNTTNNVDLSYPLAAGAGSTDYSPASSAQVAHCLADGTNCPSTTGQALTMNNSGSGASSGTTFNGATAQTLSYNTIGASPLAGSSSIVTVGTLSAGSIPYSLLTGTPTIGTWGSLNYPTWASGTPFVKMTAAGTFALDTNTYLTSLSGALLATGATTGATSQAQVFTDGVIANATSSFGTVVANSEGRVWLEHIGIPINSGVQYITYDEGTDQSAYRFLASSGSDNLYLQGSTSTQAYNLDPSALTYSTLMTVNKNTGNVEVNGTFQSGTATLGASSTASNGSTQQAICLADGTGCPATFSNGGTAGCSISGQITWKRITPPAGGESLYNKYIFGYITGFPCVGTFTLSLSPSYTGPQGVFYSSDLSTGVTVTSLSTSSVTLTSSTGWAAGTVVIEGW